METVDVAVIGGGLLGCFAARNLTRYKLRTVLMESAGDVCTQISKANSSIVYPGYDNEPGSGKAQMTARACREFDLLCRELEVPFTRCGSLMVAIGEQAEETLRKKLEQGIRNGVSGMRLLSGKELSALEPGLSADCRVALFCSMTGVVNPWRLCYAAYENALANGCRALLSTRVTGITKSSDGYRIHTDRDDVACRAIINCAGARAADVQEMLFSPRVRIRQDASDFMVLKGTPERLRHVLFEEKSLGKGITAVPTSEGNILLCSAKRPLEEEPRATRKQGLENLLASCRALVPELNENTILHTFSGIRPNPYYVESPRETGNRRGRNIGDFVIDHPEETFISLIGVKTPGMTCAEELGKLVASKIAATLGAGENRDFSPARRAAPEVRTMQDTQRAEFLKDHPDYRKVVCLCNEVTRGEILEAIARGGRSISGVKRRCGARLGDCQGSRCSLMIAQLLSEQTGTPVSYFLQHDEW